MSPNHNPVIFDFHGGRKLSEDPIILRYSSQGEDKVRFCSHGKNYDLCCGKRPKIKFIANSYNNNQEQLESTDQDHCHSADQRAIDKKARRRLLIASSLCLTYMVVEVVCGYFADSLAIMTDAAHLLTDFANYMISLFAIWLSSRPATKRMSFGWYRAEVIGAQTSVLMIWVVTGILVYFAVGRVRDQDYEIKAEIMLITSAVGIGVNILMMMILGGCKCQGSSENADEGSANTSINVRAAFIDVIGDFIQSACVFSAAVIIYFKPEWKIVDPICTFVFAVLVIFITIPLIKDIINILMEGLPEGVDFNDVHETFFSIQGVVKVHNLRIWSLSMDKVALSAHLVINPTTNPRELLKIANRIVRDKHGFFEMTLQIEDMKADKEDCEECQGPKK